MLAQGGTRDEKANLPDTPNTKMARMFYEKYHINPLETTQSMKAVKKINMRMYIKK